jgi:hypothetical protein
MVPEFGDAQARRRTPPEKSAVVTRRTAKLDPVIRTTDDDRVDFDQLTTMPAVLNGIWGALTIESGNIE